jgi:hypothetical protein
MKILFITYFFPPDKSVGGFRAASLVDNFPKKGINVTLLTAETSEEKKKELEEKFGKENVFLSRASKIRAIGYKTKILSLVELLNLEHYFLFPDVYFPWIRRTYNIGKKIIQEGKFDAILVTLPPYSPAVVAFKLAKKFNLPLILDYRDPWSSHPGLKFPKFIVKQKHRRLERRIANYSSQIITVGEDYAELISKATGIDTKNIPIIKNGYFAENIPSKVAPKIKNKFTLSFFGNYYKAHTNIVKEFILGIRLMVDKNNLGPNEIALRYAGIQSRSTIKRDLQNGNLTDYFEDLENLEGSELIEEIQRSHVNYVFTPKALDFILTTKIYDYGLGNSHILVIGEKKAVYDWCESVEQKFTHVKGDRYAIAEELENLYKLWKENKLEYGCNEKEIAKYNREKLALKYADLLNKTIK